MLRRVASYVPVSRSAVRGFSDGPFKDRETAAEERAARERDKVLLDKLKAKLLAEKGVDNKHHVEVIEKLSGAIKDINLPKNVVEEAKKDPLTAEDFLNLRSELMNKVRSLEDELARLKVSKKN